LGGADDLVLNIITFELSLRQAYRGVQLVVESYGRNSHLPGVGEAFGKSPVIGVGTCIKTTRCSLKGQGVKREKRRIAF